MTAATGPANLHAALLYSSAAHLASAVVPFLVAALHAGPRAARGDTRRRR